MENASQSDMWKDVPSTILITNAKSVNTVMNLRMVNACRTPTRSLTVVPHIQVMEPAFDVHMDCSLQILTATGTRSMAAF